MSNRFEGFKSALSSRTVLVALVGFIAAVLSALNIVQLDAANAVSTIEILLGLVAAGTAGFRIAATKLIGKTGTSV